MYCMVCAQIIHIPLGATLDVLAFALMWNRTTTVTLVNQTRALAPIDTRICERCSYTRERSPYCRASLLLSFSSTASLHRKNFLLRSAYRFAEEYRNGTPSCSSDGRKAFILPSEMSMTTWKSTFDFLSPVLFVPISTSLGAETSPAFVRSRAHTYKHVF